MDVAVEGVGVILGGGRAAIAGGELERGNVHDCGVEHDGLVIAGDGEVHGRHSRVGGHQLPLAAVVGLVVWLLTEQVAEQRLAGGGDGSEEEEEGESKDKVASLRHGDEEPCLLPSS